MQEGALRPVLEFAVAEVGVRVEVPELLRDEVGEGLPGGVGIGEVDGVADRVVVRFLRRGARWTVFRNQSVAIKDKFLTFNGTDGDGNAGRDPEAYRVTQDITVEAWILVDTYPRDMLFR